MKIVHKNIKHQNLAYGFIGLILISVFGYLILQSQNAQIASSVKQRAPSAVNKSTCLADDCLAIEKLEYPVGSLSKEAVKALSEAIDDEYHALSFYETVISRYGMIRPFSMIKGAEEQHIASLKAIFDKYGLAVPENVWKAKVNAPETIQQACQAGVDAEIANARLYSEYLLPAVRAYPDITTVFTNLMNASKVKHLPAFERCN